MGDFVEPVARVELATCCLRNSMIAVAASLTIPFRRGKQALFFAPSRSVTRISWLFLIVMQTTEPTTYLGLYQAIDERCQRLWLRGSEPL